MQHTIILAQKKDVELCIIEGLHNHDRVHENNHICNNQYQSQNSNPGLCHGCSGPHLVRECKNSVCKRCKPNLDSHVPARCPSRKTPAKQQWLNSLFSNSPHRNQSNIYNDPHLQLSVSTRKPDHISELLEATKNYQIL